MNKYFYLILFLVSISTSILAQDMQVNSSSLNTSSKDKVLPSQLYPEKYKSIKDYTNWRLGFNVGFGKRYNAEYWVTEINDLGYENIKWKPCPALIVIQLSGSYYFTSHFGVGLKYDYMTILDKKGLDYLDFHFGVISPTLSYRYTTKNKKHTIYANLAAGFLHSLEDLEYYEFDLIQLDLEVAYDYHITDKFSMGAKVSHGFVFSEGPFDCSLNEFRSSLGIGYHL